MVYKEPEKFLKDDNYLLETCVQQAVKGHGAFNLEALAGEVAKMDE